MEPADLPLDHLVAYAEGDAGEIHDRSDVALRGVAVRSEARLRQLVVTYFDFVWRSLRRLGVPPDAVDDAAQRVFWVTAKNLPQIAVASERAYLFSTALRVASDVRRVRSRTREVQDDALIAILEHPDPGPDDLLDQKRARQILDALLEELPLDLRTVLVLVEGEGLTAVETAGVLGIPEGTVNSRLRRARAAMAESIERLQKRSISRRRRP
jgi:RNA polymerase sigma-70 factor (ECF subfamily)